MKFFTIAAAVALLAPFVQGQDLITIFFESADHRATYSQSFPLDGSTQDINPRMSPSDLHILLVSTNLFDPSHSSYACKIALL